MSTEFHTTLFTAIDSSTRMVVDGQTVATPAYWISRDRRLLARLDGLNILAENQPISLMLASGEFKDVHGKVHTIGFLVERPLTGADLRQPTPHHDEELAHA